jgi:hypothetical protein
MKNKYFFKVVSDRDVSNFEAEVNDIINIYSHTHSVKVSFSTVVAWRDSLYFTAGLTFTPRYTISDRESNEETN